MARIKRASLDLGSDVFRITKPGVNLDAAGPNDFLMHEDFLFSQPYFFGFVACPFAGDTSHTARAATVDVVLPDVTADPVVLLYPATSGSQNVFPIMRSYGSGSDAGGYAVDSYSIGYKVNSSTSLSVTFSKPASSARAPNGAYVIAMRTAE